MTKYNGSNAFIILDGYNLTQYTLEMGVSRETVFEDSSTFGDSWAESLSTGISKAGVTQSAFYDDATLGTDVPLVGLAGTNRNLVVGIEGLTLGGEYIGFAGDIESKYERVLSRSALHKVNVTHTVSGAIEDGIILAPWEAIDDDPLYLAGQDAGASSALGASGILHVGALDLGGGTNLAVTIKHSPTDGSYVSLIAFTVNATAPTSERKTVAGTVNRWTRCDWAWTGGAAQSATIFCGLARG